MSATLFGMRPRTVPRCPLPRCYRPFHCFEYWIDLDRFAFTDQLQSLGVTVTKFLFEMREFVCKLSRGDRDRDPSAGHPDFRDVEIVAALFGFVGHSPKIVCDGAAGIARLSESVELRVMAIAFGCSGQNLLGEECLAPQGNKSCSV